MMWVVIVIYVASCVGLGYAAGTWVRRRRWPGWAGGLMALAIACLWPALAVGFVYYTGSRYLTEHPGDDAPALAMGGVIYFSPYIFMLSLLLALAGLFAGLFTARGEDFVSLR